MAKLTRGRLLAGAAPLVAAPLVGKLALDAIATAADRRPEGHVHNHRALGHAAMIGEQRAGRRRAERPRRAALSAAGAAARAGPRARVHAPGDRQGRRDRAGRLLPRLDVQRHDPRACDPGDRGRHPARPVRQPGLAPAHDPLPRDPPDEHGRRLRDRPAGRRVHLRVPGHARRVAALPLPLDPAQEAHPQGALRRVHHRPEGAAPAGAGARDGDERLRHRRRRREQLLHGQRPELLLRASTRSWSSARSSCGSTSST